jgi:hypothetical protein
MIIRLHRSYRSQTDAAVKDRRLNVRKLLKQRSNNAGYMLLTGLAGFGIFQRANKRFFVCVNLFLNVGGQV